MSTTSKFEHVADLQDLPEGSLLAVELESGDEVCLFNHKGTVGAVGNVCTHAEFLMSDGELLDDGTIECAWHGARFDCASGRVCRGPASDPLPVFDVRVRGEHILVRQRDDDDEAEDE